MCQKASGAPFASFADIEHEDFTWTRGKPAAFQSSSIAERDFCAACGTPLSFRRIGGPKIEIMTGTFPRPGQIKPTRQYGTQSPPRRGGGRAAFPRPNPPQEYAPGKSEWTLKHAHTDPRT